MGSRIPLSPPSDVPLEPFGVSPASQLSDVVAGIDLGTTMSAIAYIDHRGEPVMVPNSDGEELTPSVVEFEKTSRGLNIVVGTQAKQGLLCSFGSVAEYFKRDIGNDFYTNSIGKIKVPAEVISGYLLEHLASEAQRTLSNLGGLPAVVITVPAFFDENRRRLTLHAGKLAGLKVLDIINEPTAAAVAYGVSTNSTGTRKSETVLVYDLGGGTFDVTVLKLQGKDFRTVTTDGDVMLGGRDFDQRMADLIAKRFQEATGIDPWSDPLDTAALWENAQTAKHALSARQQFTLSVRYGGEAKRILITREEFADETADLIMRTEMTIELAMQQANLTWCDIDRILLVGGSTRMPMVSEMLERISGITPDKSLHPDRAVAMGAALYAATLAKPDSSRQFKLHNVSSHSLGVIGRDTKTGVERVGFVIPRDSPLPASVTKRYPLAQRQQKDVVIRVVEGESPIPQNCIQLGICKIDNLPTNLDASARVEVEFHYQSDGTLRVTARLSGSQDATTMDLDIRRDVAGTTDSLNSWRERIYQAMDCE